MKKLILRVLIPGLVLLATSACGPGVIPHLTPAPPQSVTALTFTAGETAPILQPGWTSYTNANEVTDMDFDQDGNLWTGGPGGAVQWRPDGTYTQYTVEHGLARNWVNSIAVAPDGAL